MTIGKTTLHFAACADAAPDVRSAIRTSLSPLVQRLAWDLGLTAEALEGPDPEYALSLFVDVLRELPAALRELDGTLASVRHLRVAA